jgi:hypothetical protein
MEERSSNAWYFQPETWPQREFWGQSVPSWPEIPNGGILGTYPQSNAVWDRSGSEGPRPATPSGMNGGILGMLTQAATERSFNPGAMINIPFGRNMPMSLALSVPRHGDYSSSFSPAQFQYENGSELTPAVRKKADQAECDHMHQQDLFHCRMVGLPACYAQAYLRYVNCLNGKQIPPLNY